jgi:hypothetical protein
MCDVEKISNVAMNVNYFNVYSVIRVQLAKHCIQQIAQKEWKVVK